MFNDQNAQKPVDVIATESFKNDGEHIERGTLLKSVPADLAMELAGAGKVRLATKEAMEEIKAAMKVKATAADAQAATPDPMAAMVAAAVTAALQAAGIVKPTAPSATA